VPSRFPILTDENVQGPVIEGLRAHGWDVVLTIDTFGQRSVDEKVFEYATQQRRVLVSTDVDCLVIADRWIDRGRPFRLLYWHQRKHQRVRVGAFLEAFEALAAKKNAFASYVEYLKIEG